MESIAYSFVETKAQLLELLAAVVPDNFKLYVVRTIYGRFSLYTPSEEADLEAIKELIEQQGLDQWVDDYQQLDSALDEMLIKVLEETSSPVEGAAHLWFSERHIEKSNWYNLSKQQVINVPLVTFYSFKGGVGRTTALVVTAVGLARRGSRVVLVDFDLEAPGLANLFALHEERNQELLDIKGIVDFAIDYSANKHNPERIDINKYFFRLTRQELVGTNGGELIIVPAAATGESEALSYVDKLSKVDLAIRQENKPFLPDVLFSMIAQRIAPDYFLIDARTGINDIGGLVFNHYASMAFLFFSANSQNAFGFKSLVPFLKNLSNNQTPFYLVNSWVLDGRLGQEDREQFLEWSYKAFDKYFYDDDIPDKEDKTADHYPLEVRYNTDARYIIDYKVFDRLLKEDAYQEMVSLVENLHLLASNHMQESEGPLAETEKQEPTMTEESPAVRNKSILQTMAVKLGIGIAENEIETIEDLSRNFFPRKDYGFIFDKHKFLILGEKGMGKTALFLVLKYKKYAQALASYCGGNAQEAQQTRWIIGLDNGDRGPKAANFESFDETTPASNLKNYWLLWLCKELLRENIFPNWPQQFPIIEQLAKEEIPDKRWLNNSTLGEKLTQALAGLDSWLKEQEKLVVVLYDYLDRISTNTRIRGRLISALVRFFYDYNNNFQALKAKIFLRKDIFDDELEELVDKVKIRNASQYLEWSMPQLLNLLWKRLDGHLGNETAKEWLFNGLATLNAKEVLGVIPNYTEGDSAQILARLLGERMGGNNKAYPVNWLKSHLEDTKGRIQPRSLLWLFTLGAVAQLKETIEPSGRIIRSKNMEAVMSSLSVYKIDELGEEYQSETSVLKQLKTTLRETYSPVGQTVLKDAFREIIERRGMALTPEELAEKLLEIGVMKEYPPRKGTTEERYHFPDIYRLGLGLNRKGPN